MRKSEAKKLHNRDEVVVKINPGEWDNGYVLGEPQEVSGRIIVTVQTVKNGYMQVDHCDVK